MKPPGRNQPERHKNQLIPRAPKEEKPWFVKYIIAIGGLLLIGGAAWAAALWWSVAPPIAWLFRHWPKYMERSDVLFESSHFGHAILGPMELATLGTIILSFVHVIHQLRAQNHTEKTRFQPVVTCTAVLNYDVEGTDKAERIQIAKPYLKLRVRNLGDSPATFIDIQIKSLYYITPKGAHVRMNDELKIRSLQIDSLGKHDAAVASQCETEISEPTVVPAEIGQLISGILRSEDESDPGELELTVAVRHENVMGLEYAGEGTFFWSRTLHDRKLSDGEQFEYIESFREAREHTEQEQRIRGKATIGQFIKRNQTLQAALRH